MDVGRLMHTVMLLRVASLLVVAAACSGGGAEVGSQGGGKEWRVGGGAGGRAGVGASAGMSGAASSAGAGSAGAGSSSADAGSSSADAGSWGAGSSSAGPGASGSGVAGTGGPGVGGAGGAGGKPGGAAGASGGGAPGGAAGTTGSAGTGSVALCDASTPTIDIETAPPASSCDVLTAEGVLAVSGPTTSGGALFPAATLVPLGGGGPSVAIGVTISQSGTQPFGLGLVPVDAWGPWQQSAVKPHTMQEGIHFVALSRVGLDRVAILEAPIVPLSAFPGDAHLHTWSAGKAIGPGVLVATQGKQPAFVTSLGPGGFLIGGLPLPGAPVAFARVDCAGDVTPVVPKTGCITGQVPVAAGLPFGEAALVAVASDRAVGACDDVGPPWIPRVHLLLQGASGPMTVGDELSATEMPTRLRLLPRPGGAWLVVTDASGTRARRVDAKGKLLGGSLDLGNVKDVASLGERLAVVTTWSLRLVGDGFASETVALTAPKGEIVRAWLAVSPTYDKVLVVTAASDLSYFQDALSVARFSCSAAPLRSRSIAAGA